MTRSTHTILLLIALTAWSSSARAQGASVRMAGTPCAAQLPEHALIGMLEVELFGDRVARVGDLSADEAIAAVDLASTCGEPLVVHVRTRDRLTEVSLARVVDLGDVPSSLRVRTLALSIAELLRATWQTTVAMPDGVLLTNPPLRLPPPRDHSGLRVELRAGARLTHPNELRLGLDSAGNARSSTGEPERPGLITTGQDPAWRSLAVGLDGMGRLFPQTGLVLVGGRAALEVATLPGTGLVFDAGALGGSTVQEVGDVGVLLVPLGVSWTVQASAGDVRLEIGPRLEGGAVQLRWGPQRRTGWGAYLIATGAGYLRVRLGEGAWASIAADLGWTVVGPEVAGVDATLLAGPTMSISVALLAAP